MNQPRFIKLSDLVTTKTTTGLLPVSASTCWRLVKKGHLPPPFKLGDGTTLWDLEEIEETILTFKAKRGGK